MSSSSAVFAPACAAGIAGAGGTPVDMSNRFAVFGAGGCWITSARWTITAGVAFRSRDRPSYGCTALRE
jgi:hypothetical protein